MRPSYLAAALLRHRPEFWALFLKGGAIGVLVSQFDDQLNSAINTLTGKYAVSSDYATKVVPVITVGDGSYAGAAQVAARMRRWKNARLRF